MTFMFDACARFSLSHTGMNISPGVAALPYDAGGPMPPVGRSHTHGGLHSPSSRSSSPVGKRFGAIAAEQRSATAKPADQKP